MFGDRDSAFSPAEQVLDPAVRSLFCEDAAAYVKLTEIFLVTAATYLAELEEACACGDASRIEDAAHALASSADAIGAQRLGRRCRQLETDGATCDRMLEQVRGDLHEVVRHLQSEDGTSRP